MAKLHTDLPTAYSGERQLAQTLAALNDPVLHLWFALDYLPGVPDIDCLLWHEEIGVFVIEVKAVPLVAIEWLDYKRCKIVDREEGRSPVCQAYEAFWNFRSYLHDRGVSVCAKTRNRLRIMGYDLQTLRYRPDGRTICSA